MKFRLRTAFKAVGFFWILKRCNTFPGNNDSEMLFSHAINIFSILETMYKKKSYHYLCTKKRDKFKQNQ